MSDLLQLINSYNTEARILVSPPPLRDEENVDQARRVTKEISEARN